MFSQFIKMKNEVNVRFRVADGKIYVKNLPTLEIKDYEKVVSTLNKLVDNSQVKNFTASVKIPL
jgi:hypothetical protein